MMIHSGCAIQNLPKQRVLKGYPNPVNHSASSTDLNEIQDTFDSSQRSSSHTVLSRSLSPELNFDMLDDEILDEELLDDKLEKLLQAQLSDRDAAGNPAETRQNPFHHKTVALPSQRTFPEKQSQQPEPLEMPDFNEQQPSTKMRRPSRHPQYPTILTSEQTDDEVESTDIQAKRRALNRISKRKSRQAITTELGISVAECERQYKQAAANKRGITVAELDRQYNEASAHKRGISLAEFLKQKRQAKADKHGIPLSKLSKYYKQAAADKHGIPLAELSKYYKQVAAQKRGKSDR